MDCSSQPKDTQDEINRKELMEQLEEVNNKSNPMSKHPLIQ